MASRHDIINVINNDDKQSHFRDIVQCLGYWTGIQESLGIDHLVSCTARVECAANGKDWVLNYNLVLRLRVLDKVN